MLGCWLGKVYLNPTAAVIDGYLTQLCKIIASSYNTYNLGRPHQPEGQQFHLNLNW